MRTTAQWILRHGAHPDVLDFPLVRGLYDMVFGYEDGDYDRPAFAAGLAVLLTGIALFQYKGAFFWKMTAGMGDVVIAPLYQALRRRGRRSSSSSIASTRCISTTAARPSTRSPWVVRSGSPTVSTTTNR